MSLQRKAIRTALVSALIAANTAAGPRVYASRVVDWDAVELPAVGVYFERGSAEIFEEAPRRYLRTAELRIECVADRKATGTPASKKVPQDLADAIDELAGQVENVLFLDPELGGKCHDIKLVGDEFDIASQGSRHIAALALRWQVEFLEEAPKEAPADDLNVTGVQWDLAPPDGEVEAEDELQMEQDEAPE